MADIPQGWVIVNLQEVAELNMGQSPPSKTYNKEGKGLPFFQGKAEFGDIYPIPAKYCSRPSKIAEPDDILISVRAPVGPTNLSKQKSCIGRGLAGIRPLGKIPNRYLFYYLRSIEEWLSRQGTGSTFTAISRKNLEQLTVPLAPINEQRRIVAKLEKLLEKVDDCRTRLEKIPVILKRFRQAVLAAACSGRLTADWHKDVTWEDDLPVSWSRAELGNLVVGTPKNGLYKPQSDYGRGTPILRIDNFYDGYIESLENLKRVAISETEQEQYKLTIDDIVVNRVNSIKFLGKSALVRNLFEPTVFESNMMRIRVDKEKISAQYAITYLCSLIGLEELRKNAKHAVNQSSINQGDVKAVLVNLSPLPEQEEIVQRVQELFTLADRIEGRYKKAKAYVDKLTQSILAKTFRGELVAQDPNDEPASELLKQIRKEQKSKKELSKWFNKK